MDSRPARTGSGARQSLAGVRTEDEGASAPTKGLPWVRTGEVERLEGGVGGIAVHVGARVAGKAAGGEVLVTRTVMDLVSGSGIEFATRGTHALKGVPGRWLLFAVTADSHP